MLPAQTLRSPVGIALDKAAAGEELTEQDRLILGDLDDATPEEIREALDAEGIKRPDAFMVKMRIGPPGSGY